MKRLWVTLKNMPFLARSYWVISAATPQHEWDVIVRIFEEMHERGLDSDDTHYRLGEAFFMMERWQEAAAEFRAIERTLPDREQNERRSLNQAFALAKLGQNRAALSVLRATLGEEWSLERREKRDRLIEYLTERDVVNVKSG